MLYIVNFDIFVSTVSNFSSFAYASEWYIRIVCAITEGTLAAAVSFIICYAADVGFIGMILFKVLPAVDILVGIMCIGIIYPCIIHE